MSSTSEHVDRGRISIYDLNTDDIQLSPLDLQLKTHTGYDDEHLRRLKYLFQQATGPDRQTLNMPDFESAARSLCRFLTESNSAHHLAEVLFQIYDKNTNGSIDFGEMVDFVWYNETVVDAPREEQIASLYQALRGSNETLSRDQLIELLIIFREDLQSKPSSINKASLNTDDDIRRRVEECLRYYQKSAEGLSLQQLVDYFLGSKEPLAMQVKARWNARMDRDEEKKKKKKGFLSSSPASRRIKRSTSSKSSAPNQMQRDTQSR